MVHYKSGNSFPELYSLISMAEYLECSVDELMGYKLSHILFDETATASDNFRNENEFADYLRLRLCNFMDVNGISTKELSRRASISTKTIDIYLSVHRWIPRTADFLRICDALECTPSELLGY